MIMYLHKNGFSSVNINNLLISVNIEGKLNWLMLCLCLIIFILGKVYSELKCTLTNTQVKVHFAKQYLDQV